MHRRIHVLQIQIFILCNYCIYIQIFQEMHSDSQPPLLQYETQYQSFRASCLKSKTIEELKNTSSQQIRNQFELLSSAEFPENAFNTQNNKMNRYIDIFAYEHSRINLTHIPNYYINANQVKSLLDGQVYSVFSQAPVKKYDNFWEAIYYKNVTRVVMLCSFYDPKRGHQSEQYWPDEGKSVVFSSGKLQVKNLSSDSTDKEYIVTKFQIQGPQGPKNLTHIHWMGWSDLKKPAQENMQRFQEVLTILLNEIESKHLIWIHCSAGIGRTGTLGGVIEALRLYKKKKQFSIFEIVENMRRYRYHAVQTLEQYKFLYQYLCKKLG